MCGIAIFLKKIINKLYIYIFLVFFKDMRLCYFYLLRSKQKSNIKFIFDKPLESKIFLYYRVVNVSKYLYFVVKNLEQLC